MTKIITIFIILSMLCVAQDIPKEKDGYTQVRNATNIKDPKESIKALKQAILYWPDFRNAAENNIANKLMDDLRDYEKAEKIFWNLLILTKDNYHARRWVECKTELDGSDQKAIDIIVEKFPDCAAEVLMSQSYRIYQEIIQEMYVAKDSTILEKKIPLINKPLIKIILNHKVTLNQSMIIREFIAKLPLMVLALKIKFSKEKGKTFKGIIPNGGFLVDDISMRRSTGLFSNRELMSTKEGYQYILNRESAYLGDTVRIITDSAFKKNILDKESLLAIDFLKKYRLSKYNIKKLRIILLQISNKLTDDKDKKVIQELINHHENP